jgi:predicted metalloprotease
MLDGLFTLWRTQLGSVCAYDSLINGGCGLIGPGNAFYCPNDNSIGWDFNCMTDEARAFGEFAPVVILAHEWGHRNQAVLGFQASSIAIELNADCQAGIFAAVQESLGMLQMGDVCAAFQTFCAAGDPDDTPWFAPNAHGVCAQRVQSFENGYLGAKDQLERVCGSAPLQAMQDLCPLN